MFNPFGESSPENQIIYLNVEDYLCNIKKYAEVLMHGDKSQVGKVILDNKLDVDGTEITNEFYIILKQAGFEIKQNENGAYNIIDKENGDVFEEVMTVAETIKAVWEYVDVSVLTDFQKEFLISEQIDNYTDLMKIAKKFQRKDITD